MRPMEKKINLNCYIHFKNNSYRIYKRCFLFSTMEIAKPEHFVNNF